MVTRCLITLLVVINCAPTLATAQEESEQDSAVVPPSPHPILGLWLVTMAGQTGQVTFTADGSATVSLAPIQYGAPGKVQTGPAIGTWEAMGETGATFTVVQRFWSERGGVVLGSATTTGYVVLNGAADTLLDDGTLTTIILRDAKGRIISVRAADANAPFLTATRPTASESEAAPASELSLRRQP